MPLDTLSIEHTQFNWKADPASWFLTLVLAVVTFAVLSPIILLLLTSLQSSTGGYSLEAWITAFREPGIMQAFLNTLIVTAWVQGISIPIF